MRPAVFSATAVARLLLPGGNTSRRIDSFSGTKGLLKKMKAKAQNQDLGPTKL